MNKVQRNARAYQKLFDIEYVFCLSYNGHGKKVTLRFEPKDFHHLEGIGQLKDLAIHRLPGHKSFEMALNGEITEEDLRKSELFDAKFVENKINHLYLLEKFIDSNDIIFNFMKKKAKTVDVQAKIFLYKDMSGQEIYLFLDLANEDYYFPRSFMVEPNYDYKNGQYKYAMLWKEKRNTKTGESEVLYQLGDFTPDKLKE